MKKIDGILAAIIGFLNGVFFLFILKQVEVSLPFSLPGWILPIIFPILSILGLFFAHFLSKKILVIFQAAKFFLVGTLNTFIDLGVLNILSLIFGVTSGLFYSVFKTISFLVATTNSYFWNKYWTFEKREVASAKELSKFFMVTAVGLLINVSIASVVVNVIGPQFGLSEKIWLTLGGVAAAFGAFVWNFLGSKFIVFKK